MIMWHTANSHFASLPLPGLTSQCISSIMQRHWDPFHCVPQHVRSTQRFLRVIPRTGSAAWFNGETTDIEHQPGMPSCLPAFIPACLAPLCCRAWWLDYHTSRVHLALSFLGHLKWHSALSQSQSMARKATEEERERGVGGGGGEEGGGGGKALPGSTVV